MMASPVSSPLLGPKTVDFLPVNPSSKSKSREEESQASGYSLLAYTSQDAEKKGNLTLHAELIKQKTEGEVNSQLWSRVHAGIKDIHERARANLFLLNLIQGKMTCSKAYVVYLCNLYWLHAALEEAQQAIQKKFGPGFFVYPELFRSHKILADIKLWSVFNETAHLFADKNPQNLEFVRNMEPYLQESTLKLAFSLREGAANDLAKAFGTMYALYGTIMSGGQFVKKGVKASFLERLQFHIEEYQEELKYPTTVKDIDPESLAYAQKEYSLAKTSMIQAALATPENIEKMAEESVSLFSFDNESFSIPVFKKEWHQSLSELPGKLQLEDEGIELFERQLIECAGSAIDTVLVTIASLEENLRKGVI